MTEPTFVRASATPKDFNGVWQVWIRTRCYGTVQRGPDPIKNAEPWGWWEKPSIEYPNGRRCLYGYKSRKAAGAALVEQTQKREAQR